MTTEAAEIKHKTVRRRKAPLKVEEVYNFYHKMPKEQAVAKVIELLLDHCPDPFDVAFEDGGISIWVERENLDSPTGIREVIGSSIGGWYFVIYKVGDGYIKQFRNKS